MLRVLSTHLFLNHRLHPGLLELAERSGAQAVEIFAARQHFDYTSREDVAELAEWFRGNALQPFSMHAPLYADREMGRSGGLGVNVLHPDKARRIDAMDEIKRALEAAEHIPLRNLVVHLGERDDAWSQRTIELALTALEHLGAFARPLGVRLLVENLLSEATTPEHLVLILEMGHLASILAMRTSLLELRRRSPLWVSASHPFTCMTIAALRTSTCGPAMARSTGR
jgi:sugar phosphate isomerase/epimerase